MWFFGLLLLGACDPDVEDSADAWCAYEPVVTWASNGEGLIREHCQPCHGSDAIDRKGAPESVVFDDEQDVIDQADAILRVSVGDDPTMPPAVAMDELDQELMTIWLTCWLPEDTGT